MNNFLVSIRIDDSNEKITTIVLDKTDLMILMTLLKDSQWYSLESIKKIDYENYVDLISELKKEVKPKGLVCGDAVVDNDGEINL